MSDERERRFTVVDHERRVRLPIYSAHRDRIENLVEALAEPNRWTVIEVDLGRSAYPLTKGPAG